MGQRTPRQVFEKLVERGFWRSFMGRAGSSDGERVRRHRRNGTPLAEDLLPGREVMRLSPAEREALQGLTADMTQDRQ
jgi:hypothetical protein